MKLRAILITVLVGCFVPSFAQPSGAVPKVVQARTTTAKALPDTTDPTSIQAITLTSGSWAIVAKAFVVDTTSGESDFFRCELFRPAGAKHLDVAAAFVSTATIAKMITNIAKVQVAAGATMTIQQRCWHDHADIHGYVDPGATLLASKAPSATQNRVDRSTSTTSLGPIGQSTVASLGLTAGTWVYGFKATAVDVTTNHDFATCSLPDDRVRQGVGTDTYWSRAATFAAFGVVTVNTASTISVTCQSDSGSGIYLDPGIVFWARRVTSSVTGNSCGTVGGVTATTDAVADMRTTACGIGFGTGASQVGGTAVTPGTWVLLGAEQGDLSSIVGGFVRCRATNPGANKVLDAHADYLLNPDTDDYMTTTFLGKLTTSTNTNVEFRCGLPGSGGIGGAVSDAGGYVVFKP